MISNFVHHFPVVAIDPLWWYLLGDALRDWARGTRDPPGDPVPGQIRFLVIDFELDHGRGESIAEWSPEESNVGARGGQREQLEIQKIATKK